MTSVLDLDTADTAHQTAPVSRLRTQMLAMRVSFTWLGTRKTLSPDQKARAADTFGAERKYLSAGKKLLDTSHPSFKAVTAIRNRAVSYWKGISLPFPEPGIRLIRQDDLEATHAQMERFQQDLGKAVAELDEHYHELKQSARDRLGSLYCEADYPVTLRGLFDIQWEFPSVEPPDYLQRLNPEVYRQQCDRVAAQFDEAVRMAEQAFAEELSRLVSHLAERLSGQSDGKPKVFRDSAVENLGEFFERFSRLNIRSSEELDALVSRAQQVIRGVGPQDLRDSGTLRQEIGGKLASVEASLEGLLVDRPRRNILRPR